MIGSTAHTARWINGIWGSEADKGKCKAEKEMAFLQLLLYPDPIDGSLLMLQVYHLILSKDYNALIIKAIIDVPLYLYC